MKKKKIIAITLDLLQQLIWGVAKKFEVIGLCNKIFIALNFKYIYFVAINILLFQISCKYRHRQLLHKFYYNRLQIIDQNKSD